MFDKNVRVDHHESPRYPQEVTVTHHAAPTADTAKMLKDLTDEAQRNIVAVFRVDSNVLKCRWFVQRDMNSPDYAVVGKAILNEKAITFKIEIDRFDLLCTNEVAKVGELVRQKMLGILSEHLTRELFASAQVQEMLMMKKAEARSSNAA